MTARRTAVSARDVPEATVARLPVYLRALTTLADGGVNIVEIRPVGQYGVTLVFDDGHDTGIYSWDWLHHLAVNHESLWAEYLERLEKAGASRDIDSTTLPPKSGGCGSH